MSIEAWPDDMPTLKWIRAQSAEDWPRGMLTRLLAALEDYPTVGDVRRDLDGRLKLKPEVGKITVATIRAHIGDPPPADALPKQRQNRTWPSGSRCIFCQHWFDQSLSHGDCRRFPAKVVTSYMDWCAEFAEQEGRDEPKSESEPLT